MNYYLVGGAVRDRFLGKQPKDLDYAVEAPSFAAMREDILAKGGEIVIEREQFGTIRACFRQGELSARNAFGNPMFADYVLCRKDGLYSDGRRPDFVSVGTIFDDLARRDFTINAMALNVETKELIDPHGGQQDLRDRVIRCVGSAEKRMQEDALRLLRAFRFAVTLGFDIHHSVDELLKDEPVLWLIKKNVSIERVYEELRKCFAHDTHKTISLLDKYPELKHLLFWDCEIKLTPKP